MISNEASLIMEVVDIPSVEHEGRLFYIGSAIAEALGYGRLDSMTRLVDAAYKETLKVDELPHNQAVVCLSRKGVRSVLSRVHKPVPDFLLDQFDVANNRLRLKRAENTVIKKLQTVFSAHELSFQHKCGSYRIDVALPEYAVAIEVDENGHSNYDGQEEARRESYIKQQGYTLIRYNPEAESIERLYRRVHEAVLKAK